MDRFYGFDLGDAESAVSTLNKRDQAVPEILSVSGEKSFVTAFACLRTGEILLGEKACYSGEAVKRKLRFKSEFLKNPSIRNDILVFAKAVLMDLQLGENLRPDEEAAFYIGCPAGWDKNAREQYRNLFEIAGYPPVKIVSESRAALVSACQSRHLQVGYDILAKPVLVIDIGSSTTDFAYINSGKEIEMQTAGEVSLGGGIMDELLLSESVAASRNREELQRIFRESEPWRTYCEFKARRLKEKYYSDEEFWEKNDCRESVMIYYDKPVRLTIRMNREMADKLENQGCERLEGKSFREVFQKSMEAAGAHVAGRPPELLFLTGGVSKLPKIRVWCREAFPDAVVITGTEPEFSVSRGLAYCGRIDEEMREFRAELEELKASSVVEDVVHAHIRELYRDAVNSLVEPVLQNCAVPVFERWRDGEIRRLSDTDQELQDEVSAWLRSDAAHQVLVKPVSRWLKTVAGELEEYTVPICARHHVPYTALDLTSFLALSELDIRIDAKNIFAVEEVTLMIDSIISIVVGLLCGGSGITLIASGPTGIVAGVLLSLIVLILGKGKMEEALLNVNLPRTVRKMIPGSSFRKRLKPLGSSVRQTLFESLEKDKNEQITERMVGDISEQIELCLTKMAEVVEIPLG
ncbi:MAG: Hsp70 family protein [Blautia sp.]|nr:Hsp70 family protein [Blautia sp.]